MNSLQRIFYHLILPIALLLQAVSCEKEPKQVVEDGPVDLCITVQLPAVATTKTGYADGDVSEATADGATWSDWERLVDGQRMYRLTFFLIREDTNTLVAYRDICYGSTENTNYNLATSSPASGYNYNYGDNGFWDGSAVRKNIQFAKAAKLTFLYDHPMHGSIEKLRPGKYRMMAVANYSAISNVDNHGVNCSYAGFADDTDVSDFSTIISNVLTAFDADAGITNFDATHYPELFKYEVRTIKVVSGSASYASGTDQYVCEQRPQPLSMVDTFSAFAGGVSQNSISGEMVRTYSRIRIVLENLSDTNKLELQDFSFSTSFSQSSIYLFDEGDDASFTDFGSTAGEPVIDSDYAIAKYAAATLPKRTGTDRETVLVYDAYILESQLNANYKYLLDIVYKNDDDTNVTVDLPYSLTVTTPCFTPAEIASYYDNPSVNGTKKFVIQPIRKYKETQEPGFWYEGDERLYRKEKLTVSEMQNLFETTGYEPYMWELERNPETGKENQYYLKNVSSGNYVSSLENPGNGLPMVSTDYYYYQFGNKTVSEGTKVIFDKGVYLKKLENISGSNCYVNLNSNQLYVGYWSGLDSGSLFVFYPVSGGPDKPASFNGDIVLQTLDDTNSAVDVDEIRRNDYINVLVSASYFPDGGIFKFVVIPWVEKSGINIDFS